MGVSIILIGPRGGETDITPGWRSMMYGLMMDEFETGGNFWFIHEDLPRLHKIAEQQRKGEREPPFDWADDIKASFDKIIAAVEKYGKVLVECSH